MPCRRSPRYDRGVGAPRAGAAISGSAKKTVEDPIHPRSWVIQLRTLGSIDLRDSEGRALTGLLTQPKRLALLAYLAVALPRGLHRRDIVLALFWPEFPQNRARNALNKALYFIRRQVGSDVVVSRGYEEIGVDESRLWCDAIEFEETLDKGRTEEAVGLYTGPFLDGLFVSGAPEFELWLEKERERLARRHTEALESLAIEAACRGDPETAARRWRAAIEQDPFDSRPVLGLMKALAASGKRGEALREANRHSARLREELLAEPDPAVIELADRLRRAPSTGIAGIGTATPMSEAGGAPAWDSVVVRGRRDDAPSPRTLPPRSSPDAPEQDSKQRLRLGLPSMAAAIAALVVIGAAILARLATPELRPGEAAATAAVPAVVVLPFAVSDSEVDAHPQGMVNLLSTNLEGVEGLRVIDSRIIQRAWDDNRPAGISRLEVARRAGADYAVFGRAAPIGPDLAFLVTVHDTRSGARLASIEARGLPDSLGLLADRLSLKIIRAVLEKGPGDARRPRVEGATTTSLAALKSYLKAERAFQDFNLPAAIEAYQRAILTDSTFVFARYRLAVAAGWANAGPTAAFPRAALRFVDELPHREAQIVRAYFRWQEGSPDTCRELLLRLLQVDPGIAEAWYLLGELYYHFGGQLLSRPGDYEQALARAIELEPGILPYHWHYIERAFLEADSAAAAQRLAALLRIDEDHPRVQASRLAFDLGFGDSDTRVQAQAELEKLSTQVLGSTTSLLDHPRFFELKEQLSRRVVSRLDRGAPPGDASLALFETLLARGKLGAAQAHVDDATMSRGARAFASHLLLLLGVKLPTALEQTALAFSPPDTLGWLYAGAQAIDRRDSSTLESIFQASREAADRTRASGNSTRALAFSGVPTALEGYRLWKSGHAAEAAPLLELAQRQVRGWNVVHHWNMTIRLWLGRLHAELDHPAEAAHYFESVWDDWEDPFAAFETGRAYHALGESDRAAEAYRYALEAWKDSDEEIEPRIMTARAALAELEPSRTRSARR